MDTQSSAIEDLADGDGSRELGTHLALSEMADKSDRRQDIDGGEVVQLERIFNSPVADRRTPKLT